jgi:hypothetical protein
VPPVAATPAAPRLSSAASRGSAVAVRPPARNDTLEAEHRASDLLASGRGDEAAIVFDALIMKDPHYRLDPSRSSPEAISALRASKRAILPVLARRQYEEAQSALDAGDYTVAIAKGDRALSIIDDPDLGEDVVELRGTITNMLGLAFAVRTAEEETIYTSADANVVAPRPVGRQLSAASLVVRASSKATGRLEILIGRTGRVEAVKLNTPTNGYHDRMIVSAVKAWHYRPALRNGRPVRYYLVMSISLPDS